MPGRSALARAEADQVMRVRPESQWHGLSVVRSSCPATTTHGFHRGNMGSMCSSIEAARTVRRGLRWFRGRPESGDAGPVTEPSPQETRHVMVPFLGVQSVG